MWSSLFGSSSRFQIFLKTFASFSGVMAILYFFWYSKQPQKLVYKRTTPGFSSAYFRILFGFLLRLLRLKRTKIPREEGKLPSLEIKIKDYELDKSKELIQSYVSLCKANYIEEREEVPMLCLQALFGMLLLKLMGHPSFPFPLFGAVAVRNRLTQFAKVTNRMKVDVILKVAQHRFVYHGSEIDWSFEVTESTTNRVLVKATITHLFFHRHRSNRPDKIEVHEPNVERSTVYSEVIFSFVWPF
jgi:hypothetical protein